MPLLGLKVTLGFLLATTLLPATCDVDGVFQNTNPEVNVVGESRPLQPTGFREDTSGVMVHHQVRHLDTPHSCNHFYN